MQSQATAQVSDTLDRLHEYASRADVEAYLALFADDAVFMGTAKEERWPMAAFDPYVRQRMEKGVGWTYRAISRHVNISPDGAFAWFDESLQHETGEARGSGVLVCTESGWRIAHYNLCFPIPNELLRPVREIILAFGG